MFNNSEEEGADFCEAYKSQILNNNPEPEESLLSKLLKIITIIFLLALIIGISIYGYNQFLNNSTNNSSVEEFLPPVSIQKEEDETLKVELAPEEPEVKIVSPIEEKKSVMTIEKKEISPAKEVDIDKTANAVKVAIAKNEESVKSEDIMPPVSRQPKEDSESLKVPIRNSQSVYLEELAKLSEEIDKERK